MKFAIGFLLGAVLALLVPRLWPRCRKQWNLDGSYGPHACVRAKWHLGRHRCSEGARSQ